MKWTNKKPQVHRTDRSNYYADDEQAEEETTKKGRKDRLTYRKMDGDPRTVSEIATPDLQCMAATKMPFPTGVPGDSAEEMAVLCWEGVVAELKIEDPIQTEEIITMASWNPHAVLIDSLPLRCAGAFPTCEATQSQPLGKQWPTFTT